MAGPRVVRLEDVPNYLNAPGAEFRMTRAALDSPQVGLTYIRLPGGGSVQGRQGHVHDEQDEVYLVISGGPIEIKLDDDVVALHAGEVILVPPEVVRSVRNPGADAVLVAASGALPPQGDDSHPVDDVW
jgi:mannose-6-phosphate isomerase-like protein (cupin superfamily)